MISSDNNGGCLIFVAILLGGSVIALLSWFSGGRHERQTFERELVDRGVCEWTSKGGVRARRR